MAGYSGTPLAQKLGIQPGFRILVANTPKPYQLFFAELPDRLEWVEGADHDSVDFIHLFCRTNAGMVEQVFILKPLLKRNGIFWVSWPKGKSSINTDLNRETVRAHMLKTGLVDTKVAAIDQDWSGLKFVYRAEDR